MNNKKLDKKELKGKVTIRQYCALMLMQNEDLPDDIVFITPERRFSSDEYVTSTVMSYIQNLTYMNSYVKNNVEYIRGK